jgi:tRNA nucleotidyltransferase (CCA-adding enzyme)
MVSSLSGLLPRFEDLEDAISWGLKKTTPSQGFSRQLIAYSNHLSDLTKEIAERAGFPIVDVILAGSVSRETYLPWSVDIDLFARLDVSKKTELARFSSEVLPEVSSAENAQIEFRYAENPYGHFSTTIMDREVGVDIVSTVYTDKKNLTSALAVSGMARTPFHNDFLQTHLQGLTDQVRLLKWWLVRKKVYGQFGFTGFLTEFLMSHFKGFLNVLRAANEILQARIDFWQRTPSELENYFPGDQVIIVDPVDEKRNAAAGIQGIMGQYKLERFLRESMQSLGEPRTLLDETSPSVPYYELRTNFEPAPRTIDEEGSRLARVAAFIKGILKEEEITITELFLEKKPAALQFELDRQLPTARTVKGPPEELDSAVSKFKARHKHTFSKNGRLYAQKPSRFKSISALILDALRTQHWIISPDLKYLKKQ